MNLVKQYMANLDRDTGMVDFCLFNQFVGPKFWNLSVL